MKLKICLVLALLSLAAAGLGRAEAQSKSSGAVDFDSLGLFTEDDLKVDISIQGTLLSLLVEATKHEDSEFSDLVAKLEGINVKVFRVGEAQADTVKSRLAAFGKGLEQDGWERVVRVRDEGERVDTYLRSVEKRITGFVVMVVGRNGEAVLVNIVGEIDPAQIGRIGRKFRIRPLEGLGRDEDEDRTRVEIGLRTGSEDKDKSKSEEKRSAPEEEDSGEEPQD
jgi:hypothetical protein